MVNVEKPGGLFSYNMLSAKLGGEKSIQSKEEATHKDGGLKVMQLNKRGWTF
jgi:hypothetical protein